MDLKKYLCCCRSCCPNSQPDTQMSVRYTKLIPEEQEKKRPQLFSFPQESVGPFHPPMFVSDKAAEKRLASPHSKKFTRIVSEQPKKRQIKNLSRSKRVDMDQPPTNPKQSLNGHVKKLAEITGMEPSRRVHQKTGGRMDAPTLQLSLEYDVTHSVLMVYLISASNLPAMDKCGTSDPYVVVCLFPSQEKQVSTVVRKSLNPTFKQKFHFRNVYPSDIGSMILYFDVYDQDKLTKDDVIGRVTVPLDDDDLFGSIVTFEISKSKPRTSTERRGVILLSLSYDDDYNVLNGEIIRLGNLPKMDSFSGTSDPYVIVQLLHHNECWKDWKSSKKSNTLDAEFHEAFHFSLQEHSINDCWIRITVYDADHLKRDSVIGIVCLGTRVSQIDARRHWEEILLSPQPVCRWLPILPAT